MDIDQAKEILASCRPGGRDVDDPAMAEALEAARRDPELAAWLEEDQGVDAAIRRKLKEVNPPEDLLKGILAARKVESIAVPVFRRHGLALAAGLVFLLGLAAYWFNSRPANAGMSLASFRADMGDFLSVFPRLDLETERVQEVRDWLAKRQPAAVGKIPVGLEKFPSIGCREVVWQGRKTALVCFMVDGEVVHLFVLDKADWMDAGLELAVEYERQGAMSTAAWTEGESLYVALSPGSEAFLRKYL